MDSFERKEFTRMKESRDKWKHKAKERHTQVRQLKRTIRDLIASRNLWKEKYFSLRRELVKPSPPHKSKVVFIEMTNATRRNADENEPRA